MPSTPSSSTPRATGTGPPSQLTASVVKFQCLFTHDLRRKLKRWQDGYLRYHAFNKRIMVYDEQGNFVGDHHWRSTEEVLDGDEFELDKGVLIQVGERMSTTQTDISNLFEKRKSSQTSPQSHPGSQLPRPSTAVRSSGSSQPFRSLNDLLGIRKTPIGHLVSPYEERHRVPLPSSTAQPSEPERAPKRQRPIRASTIPAHELPSTNAEFFPSDSTQFILEEMADTPGCERPGNPTKALQNSSIPRNLPAKRSLDAPLRKSLSDPTALTARPSLQARPTFMRSAMSTAPEPAKDVEEGPWTPEALDLFDFWPPGRPKPGSPA
ncbi:uncharacterized protein N7459_007953 [Penicillium hispanicum]|uniref:uncharacterized protein n=1 Tax=Penicillium hispanicum TaxID=1080232 RepID=UPI002541D5CA|nr:uncharacterized protein N7459_007953 [Penicillium hispanicum]KAJ5573526.1 hypothetical protein N7459_007953 [Penicillium hispanicum]